MAKNKEKQKRTNHSGRQKKVSAITKARTVKSRAKKSPTLSKDKPKKNTSASKQAKAKTAVKKRVSKKTKADVSTQSMQALVIERIQKHFEGFSVNDIVTASRMFPQTTRPDLQLALEEIFSEEFNLQPIGLYQNYSYSGLNFAALLDTNRNPVFIGPLQHEEIDIGEALPARCYKNAVWLGLDDGQPFVVLLSTSDRYGENRIFLEVVVPKGEFGLEFSRKFLHDIEGLVARSSSYRGKVISLEESSRYSGESGTIRVHKLRSVAKDEVILPRKIFDVLNRNVVDFIAQRQRLAELGMPVKKGLLFYGPPGTGKTHTIHYLASQLPDHTTLLITAGQVGLLSEYFVLARFMQPSIIVIEDADLIARDRESMNSPCEESLLNQLLNEMDGLRADAAVLFVLTTNRPEHLESALASRPGRIDQAIEFPLPDEEGRHKLAKLYSGGLELDEDLHSTLVRRTHGASPAFIKELMRRSAQYFLQEDGSGKLEQRHLNQALEDMLFSGGRLNVSLLGGAGISDDE